MLGKSAGPEMPQSQMVGRSTDNTTRSSGAAPQFKGHSGPALDFMSMQYRELWSMICQQVGPEQRQWRGTDDIRGIGSSLNSSDAHVGADGMQHANMQEPSGNSLRQRRASLLWKAPYRGPQATASTLSKGMLH